jgi:hypothetical protein
LGISWLRLPPAVSPWPLSGLCTHLSKRFEGQMDEYPIEDTVYQGAKPSWTIVDPMDPRQLAGPSSGYPAQDTIHNGKSYVPVAAHDPESVPSADAMSKKEEYIPASPEERKNIGFAKSAVILHERLDALRDRRANTKPSMAATTQPVPAASQPPAAGPMMPRADAAEAVAKSRRDRFVKFLQIIQSIITAVLSVTIAVLQIRVFAYYQGTKDTPGLYPPNLDLLPTLLLLAVALAAIIFDGAQLLVFFMPKRMRIVRKATLIAAKAHYVIVASKAVSYFFSAIVAKNSGGGAINNLWSWSCDGKGQNVAGLCTSQVSALIPQTCNSGCREAVQKLTFSWRAERDILHGHRKRNHRGPRHAHPGHYDAASGQLCQGEGGGLRQGRRGGWDDPG